ncbi:hypothetical protein Ancab_003436 [Ancistrocladus abbreviatus]
MSLISKTFLSNSTCCVNSHFSSNSQIPQIKNLTISLSPLPTLIFNSSTHLQTSPLAKRYPVSEPFNSSRTSNRWSINVYDLNGVAQDNEESSRFKFDDFLSLVELTCLVSSLAISVGFLVKWVFFRQLELKSLVALGNRVLVWLLAGAVAVGAVIRRRQWRRVCGVSTKSGVGNGKNTIERIEKLEENLRSATTIIRMLSRQLEKLGIRFRVTRKALKEPMSEAAALAQKNSEATRALALQEDILEKELAEVQKVLLAMQDQQQKQLELILAIAKTGKLHDTKHGSSGGSHAHGTQNQTDEVFLASESSRRGFRSFAKES